MDTIIRVCGKAVVLHGVQVEVNDVFDFITVDEFGRIQGWVVPFDQKPKFINGDWNMCSNDVAYRSSEIGYLVDNDNIPFEPIIVGVHE